MTQGIEITITANGTEADDFGDISITMVGDTRAMVGTTRRFIADVPDMG